MTRRGHRLCIWRPAVQIPRRIHLFRREWNLILWLGTSSCSAWPLHFFSWSRSAVIGRIIPRPPPHPWKTATTPSFLCVIFSRCCVVILVAVALVLSRLDYCNSCLWGQPVMNCAAFNSCRTGQVSSWILKIPSTAHGHSGMGCDTDKEETAQSSNLPSVTSTGFLWRIILTTGFFHWPTTTSVAPLLKIFWNEIIFFVFASIIFSVLLSHSNSRWKLLNNNNNKNSSASELPPTLSLDSGMPSLRHWESESSFFLFFFLRTTREPPVLQPELLG